MPWSRGGTPDGFTLPSPPPGCQLSIVLGHRYLPRPCVTLVSEDIVFYRTRVQGGRKSRVYHCHRASAFCTHAPCLRGFWGCLTSSTGRDLSPPHSPGPLFHHILFPLFAVVLATRSSPPGHLRNDPSYLLKAQKTTGVSLAQGPTAPTRGDGPTSTQGSPNSGTSCRVSNGSSSKSINVSSVGDKRPESRS